jgi:hypothetical protein
MRSSKLIAILLIPLVIVLLSASVLVFNLDFYAFVFEKSFVNKDAGVALTENFFLFVFDDVPLDVLTVEEQAHMRDVKNVLFAFRVFTVISLFLLVLLLYFLEDAYVLVSGGVLTVGLIVLSILAPFDKLFVWFHQLFFPQGNWVFPSHYTLVSIYTIDFFNIFFVAIGLISVVLAFVCILLGFIATYTSRNHNP